MTFARPATPAPHDEAPRPAPPEPVPVRPVAAVVVLLAAALTALSGRYGYHRDELYFLEAGRHPAWGYVDQPPLTPLLARASTVLFGDTPAGLRVVSTLAYVLIVVMVTLQARELGGGRRAQVLAASATAASAMVLSCGHLVSTATFDILAWLVVCLLVMRLLRTGNTRWFLAIGAVAGVAVLNKYLILLLLAGLFGSLLLVGPRRVLRSGWLAAGGAIALLLVLPNLWWQAQHGWPQLTVAAGIDRKQGFENRVSFIPFQLIYLAPPFVPIWIAGWLRLWRDPGVRWARAFAVAYPLLAVIVLAAGGKFYYVIPLLIVLLAAGAEPAVRWAARGRRGWVLPTAVVFSLAVNAVATLPVLPPSLLGPLNAMNKEQGEQVGWPELVRTVAVAWRNIPPGERDRSVIFTQNYGEAAAIARYGPENGLPNAYSGHMSYHAWGPPPDSANGPVLLIHYRDNAAMPAHFVGCHQVGVIDNGYGLTNDEQGAVVQECAGIRASWSSQWPELQTYY